MSIVIALLGFTIASIILVSRWLCPRYAFPVIGLKFSIPFLYWHFKDSLVRYYWWIPDSREYYLDARTLLTSGYTPWSVFDSGLVPIQAFTGSTHTFYWYWNVLWIHVIGDTIFAPIIANVFITVIGSVIAVALIGKLGFSYRYQQLLLVFTLLHWDVLTWSSVANLKDPLVATLTILYFYLLFIFVSSSKWRRVTAGFCIGMMFLLFSVIRFYIPVVMIGVTIVWKVLEDVRLSQGQAFLRSLLASILGGIAAIFLFFFGSVNPDIGLIELSYLPFGVIHFALTPTPWDIAPKYMFLTVPAILHWLTMPLALMGAVWIGFCRRGRLLVIFVVAIVVLYAFLPDLLDPRHRLQIVYLITIMQFHGVWKLLNRRYNFVVTIE